MFAFLDTLLLWLDRTPGHYWGAVMLTGALVLASALVAMFGPARLARWNRPAVFAALLALALFAFRWPMLFDNAQSWNPDESQMIAGAIVLKSSPVFWRSVDGTTHGPLAQWPLAALGAVGMRLDFTNARIFSAALMGSVMVCTWLTLRVLFGDGLARVLVLPAAFLVVTTHFFDFFQYSSEHVPIALLAAATWLLVAETLPPEPRPRRWRLGLAGLLLGAVPFAKLQATPMGLWWGGAGLFLLFADSTAPWSVRGKRAAWLIGGALSVPLAMLVMVLANGIWRDFWDAYIAGNLMYANTYHPDWLLAWSTFFDLANRADNFPPYLIPTLWVSAGALLVGGGRCRGAELRFALLTLGGLLVSVYAALAPGRYYSHYLQLTIGPLALAAGGLVGSAVRRAGSGRRPAMRWWPGARSLIAVFLVSGLWFQVKYCLAHPVVELGRYTLNRGKLARPPVAGLLIRLTTPQDSFSLWGWEPQLYVETNRRHATREAHSALQIYGSDMRRFYRERYLSDLMRAHPPFFVDTVGPGNFAFQDRSTQAHETFAALAGYIAAHYRLIADLDGTRIYARLDRAAAAARVVAGFP